MDDPIPRRPNTAPQDAILALERMVLLLLAREMRSVEDPIQYLEGCRIGLITAAEKRLDDRQAVDDHVDYLFALMLARLRRATREDPQTPERRDRE